MMNERDKATNGTGEGNSTDTTEGQDSYTEQLPDGSPSGNATEDPEQESDTTSGGDPEDD
ncbi:hypothetical protein [Naasia lichenicola]|uniref:Uncharacterized protein n=1 Tax=Naasia lichenicola TaxID=2565933 RepID=A0A4S4FIJ4_9MICO|nr:hypothetical protein [Naasia lichenicola]THG29898.1 hypothetical protein E6C64_14725 [Naasia lichenicola]